MNIYVNVNIYISICRPNCTHQSCRVAAGAFNTLRPAMILFLFTSRKDFSGPDSWREAGVFCLAYARTVRLPTTPFPIGTQITMLEGAVHTGD